MFGVWGAATPLIRSDLGLSYQALGLLLSVPAFLAGVIEPAFGILADLGRRRAVILAGGVAFALALVAAASATKFPVLLFAFVVLWPASGGFVALSQSSLMDLDPERREHNMARWVLAGSVGLVLGPLAVAAAATSGVSWRILILALAAAGGALVLGSARSPAVFGAADRRSNPWAVFKHAVRQLRNKEVLRWLLVLELTDLMLDVLLTYLALYFVDVVRLSPAQAGLAVAVATVASLVGETAILWVLRRFSGRLYLRVSASLAAIAFIAFLAVPSVPMKVALLAAVFVLTAGWYSVPNARLYAALPGRSGTAVALSSLAGLLGAVLPLAVAFLAGRWGLGRALWICLLAPVAIWTLVPRRD